MRRHRHHHDPHDPHCVPAALRDTRRGEDRARFYLRWRLQRRIFAWFGATILVTALTIGLLSRINGGNSRREMGRVESLLGDRFAAVWDRPAERDDLGRALARELDVDVTLEDTRGAPVATYGRACVEPNRRVSVSKAGAEVGHVNLCAERYRGSTFRFLVPFGVAFLVLWGAAGTIARRLAHPFSELERVAREIGRGNLGARFTLGGRGGNEARVLGGTINDMASRIEQQLAAQRALLATVSHEIRTPLARMRLLVELARDGNAKSLDDLDVEVLEVDALVAELLAASRLDFAAITRRSLLAKDVAEQALERCGVDASVLVDEADGATFEGDPTLVARAVCNLLENGKRHGGGVVRMRIGATDERVVFEVEDDGPGIADGDGEKIFEPFYKRSADARSVGLGLSLVRRIAEAHGGRAYAKSRDGGGALVGVEFGRNGT